MKSVEEIKKLIKRGEGTEIEFKESRDKLNRDVFESVTAFLNRNGGHLFLGIDDRGNITGVNNPGKLIEEFVSQANNPTKLSPTFYFEPAKFEIEGREIVYIYIPPSSRVHKTNNGIFDRANEGDMNISDNSELVSELYLRKQNNYSENMVYPYAEMSDLRSDLFERVRKIISNRNEGKHPLSELSDKEVLESFGLIQKDYKTGKTGITLAGILLFGKDVTILNVLPHHKTDAILRRINKDRYDDRDDIRTNLFETYDRLMSFVSRYTPDPFYLEGDIRTSLRGKIFREAVANTIIHREYLNAYPAKMIIEENQVKFENASRPHGEGLIRPESFSPFPKNPKIARVFKEIGLADELGSGVRNLFKYSKIYSKTDPELIEGDIFRINIGLPILTEQATEHVTGEVTEQELLEFCRTPRTTKEIMEFLGLKHREHFRASLLKPLLESGKLQMTIPDKPTSAKQRYISN